MNEIKRLRFELREAENKEKIRKSQEEHERKINQQRIFKERYTDDMFKKLLSKMSFSVWQNCYDNIECWWEFPFWNEYDCELDIQKILWFDDQWVKEFTYAEKIFIFNNIARILNIITNNIK